MGRRPAHAERRARRAVDGRACARDCRAQTRRHHPSGLRRARAGDAGRTGQRRRHREGHHSHASRAAVRRRMVIAVLPPPRHRAADRPRQRHRVPDHAGAGDHLGRARHRFLLHPPPSRRRFHAGAAQSRHGRAVARSVPLRAHVLADLSASPQRPEDVVRQVVLRPDHARHQLEPRQAVAVRDRARARSRAGHVAGQLRRWPR